MNDRMKAMLISAGTTFAATFLLTLGSSVADLTNANLTGALVIGLIVSAGRTALSEVIKGFVPQRLGGRK